MAKLHVKMEDFITAWETSNSVAEVATKLNLKTTSVMARASKYRSAPTNLPLKQMKRGGGGMRLDIDAAKALIEKLRATPVVENETGEVAEVTENAETTVDNG